MKYAYADLSFKQFEELVFFICQKLLGMGVQKFADGVDGGRDAKFEGTAEVHPSKASPWSGKVVVQAKHTNGYNKHYTEPDFYSTKSDSSTLAKELPRINKLISTKNLDYYMLFSNRRL